VSYTPQASGVIYAECASKSNSRKIVKFGKRSALIKNEKARLFLKADAKTNDFGPLPITGPVQLTCRLYYSSRRPDLDPAMVMDWLQAHSIILNDRQVVDLHATKFLDKERPRVEWSVRQIPEPVSTGAAA